MKRLLVCSMLSSLVYAQMVHSQSIEVSVPQWQSLEKHSKESPKWQTVKYISQSQSEYTVADIFIINKAIENLNLFNTLSEEEVHWLKSIRDRGGIIFTKTSDHPDTPIQLVNLQNKAQAALALNGDKSQAAELIDSGDAFEVSNLTKLNEQTQALVIHRIDDRQVARLQMALTDAMVELDNDGKLDDDSYNFVSRMLLKRHFNLDLASRFIKRPANEHSAQFLRELPSISESLDAIQLLKVAVESDYLRSQAYQLLAKEYGAFDHAKEVIVNGLQKQEHFWDALMAAKQLTWKETDFDMQSIGHFLSKKQVLLVSQLVEESGVAK